ncbi:MAG: hypothetical protein GXC73_12555 [Chitinophagaceae bacterium]|nr:hypothetical protein [Chitinophagaceae bacterium]
MAKSKKKQQFIAGGFVEISVSNQRKVFGRLLPLFQVAVYDCVVEQYTPFSEKEIIKKPVLFYVGVYRGIVTSEKISIVGFKELTNEELTRIPPVFHQSEPNIEKCYLIYYDGREERTTPEKCIGLERASAYSDDNIIQRVEDFYSGRKNFFVEMTKVILDRSDPRYMNPKVRWSFAEEKFYRV